MTPDDLLPYLLPEVPGVPDDLAKQAIMRAANEFCVESGIWNEIQDPIPLISGVNEYEVDTPSSAQIVTIKSIWTPSRELVPVTMGRLQEYMPNWQTAQGSDPVYYNAPNDFSVIRVYPIPIIATGTSLNITIRAIYAPDQFGSTIPKFLADRNLDEVLAGAKFRLMQMPGKAWSNPALAATNRAVFDDGIIKAKVADFHERVGGSPRVRPQTFGFPM